MGKKKEEKLKKRIIDIDKELELIDESADIVIPEEEKRKLLTKQAENPLDIEDMNEAWDNFYQTAGKDLDIHNNIMGYEVITQESVTGKKKKIMKPVFLYCPECGKEITYAKQKTCPKCGAVLSEYQSDVEDDAAEKEEYETIHRPGAAGGKTYVLDTNVIISSYGQIFAGLDDNEVVITHTTIEELDRFKDEKSERGYATREAVRFLKKINEENGGSIRDGIPVNCGGLIRMETNGDSGAGMPHGWSMESPDNRIISTAKYLKGLNKKTFLITNDVLMSFKAASIEDGAVVQSYHNDIVINEMEAPYTGRRECEIGQIQLTQLYRDKYVAWKGDAVENEYFLLRCGTSSALGRYRDGMMNLVEDPNITYLHPKNAGQSFALNALLAPADEIPLVILKGAAGSGKTILAMAAALDGTYGPRNRTRYERVIISRSNTIPEREDMGFLPGGIEEKMDPLLAPFYHSIRKLITRGEWEDREQVEYQFEDIMRKCVQIQPLAYIRGITVDNAFLIIDEAQNLSIAQIKTIITRMGMNSKLVLLGDPEQIDSPKLSRNTNGLVYAAEKFKGCPMCAQVTFKSDHECIRSPLSAYAVEVL